jgi:hypothetical protein
MASASQRQKKRDRSPSTLEEAIQTLSLTEDSCDIPPAQAAFGSVGALLTRINVRFPYATVNFSLTPVQDSMPNDQDYVNFGMSCSDVCKALDRGLEGRRPDDLSPSVLGAIGQLTT